MSMDLGYHTIRNIGLGFAIGVVLCLFTLGIEAAFSGQEVVMLF